jgi:uncharacterized protein (DUF885 family)
MERMKKYAAMILSLLIIGCSSQFAIEQNESQDEKLTRLLDDYFSQEIERFPSEASYVGRFDLVHRYNAPPSLSRHQQDTQFYSEYFDALSSIQYAQLTAQKQIAFDIFKGEMIQKLRNAQHPFHLMPIRHFYGPQMDMATLVTTRGSQPFRTIKDYNGFLNKLGEYLDYLAGVREVMAIGITQQATYSKLATEILIQQFDQHTVKDLSKNHFYTPIRELPSNFSPAESEEMTKKYTRFMTERFIPGYERMRDWLKVSYLPHARESIGLHGLPSGEEIYQTVIKEYTSSDLTANDIHQLGLQQVATIHQALKGIQESVKFQGDLKDFFTHLKTNERFYFESEEALLQAYEATRVKIAPKLQLLFHTQPKEDYEVRATEKSVAKFSSGAQYHSQPEGSQSPNHIAINTYDLTTQPSYIVETLTIHEGSPGHHFQIALQKELEGISKFQKNYGKTVFVEGWALYAETLGYDLGLFVDPYQEAGHLEDQLLRAIRMVVDTGIHAKKWTSEQAIQYIMANSVYGRAKAQSMVNRYVGWPGQALSYMMGKLTIERLRDHAIAKLGDRFDIREFHHQVLKDGAVSMDVLEKKINQWIMNQLNK